ncbi:MAG: sporulation-delaying protein SdpB family protein [Flavobacteriaceae bacterium]
MLNDIATKLHHTIGIYENHNPWTNVYGLARTIFAFGFFLTLVFTGYENLFPMVDGQIIRQPFQDFEKASIFFVFSKNIEIAYYLTLSILITVISGYLPQIFGILHWWVAWSYTVSGIIIEGGDQISSIITFLLIPICLSDNRLNHWFKPKKSGKKKLKFLVWSFYAVIIIQISIIYLHAAVAKLSVTEWIDGTAIYYWFTHNIFGVSDSFTGIAHIVLSNSTVVVFISWGTILLELTLFSWVFMTRNTWNWKVLLFFGVSFHLGIALIHGLVSFMFTMIAALTLYLIPKHKHYNFKKLKLCT